MNKINVFYLVLSILITFSLKITINKETVIPDWLLITVVQCAFIYIFYQMCKVIGSMIWYVFDDLKNKGDK